MDTNTIHSIIKRSLPKDSWNEVISALRQDNLVWDALQNQDYLEKLQDVSVNGMEDWLPANLGLRYIDLPQRAKDFQSSSSPLLENDLFNQAMLLLEDVKEGNNVSDLEGAMLIALALREKHYLGDSWQAIQQELGNCYPSNFRSVMACLFGLVDKPNELLGNFTIGKNQLDYYLVILHTILSNPIGVSRQIDILIDLMFNRWYKFSPQPLDHLNAIQYLSLTNPSLATGLSNKLLTNNADWVDYESSEHIGRTYSIRELEVQLLSSELIKLADTPSVSNMDTVFNKSTILDLLVELSINNPILYSEQNSILAIDGEDYENPADRLFQEEIFKNHPLYLENSLLQLLDRKEYAQAMDFIHDHRNDIPSDILISISLTFSSFFSGNIQESLTSAHRALENLRANDSVLVELLLNQHKNVIYEFIRVLSDLDLYHEAVDLLQNALSICPRDVNLHMMMGEASLREGSLVQALLRFYDASMLASDNLNIRKKLAYCLERIGNWNEAYMERKYILEEVRKIDEGPDIADLHALAECALNLDYLDEAIQLCREAIDINDETGYSYSLIGEALIKQGETDNAFENFEKGIQLSPGIPEVWLALFEAQTQDNNTSDAIETLHAASQSIPESTEIHLALGELQLEQNALTEALTTFKKGAELDPQNTRLALKLGMTLHLLGHLDAAREVLGQAHHRRPNNPEIAYEYAKVLLESGEKRSALSLLEIVVNSNPRSPAPYLEYAETILTTDFNSDSDKHLEKAASVLKKVIESDTDNSIAHALLGESLAAKGEFLDAQQAFQFALETDLVEEKVWFARLSLGMGRVALALGKEDIALASLQEAVQIDPNNPHIHRALSEVYQAVNLLDNALQSARSALNMAIDDVDTLSWYAEQMLLISDRELDDNSEISSNELMKQVQIEALNSLQQAIQIAPENSELIVKLGKLQLYLGDNANAIETLNSIIENDNAGIRDLTAAGKLLKELGDNCGAIACLEQAWSLDSESVSQQSPMMLLDLANLYYIEEDNDSAIGTLNKSLGMFPTFAPIYSSKAKILLSLKNENEALACTLEGLERSPEDKNQISLYLLASKIYRIKGDLNKAIDYGFDGISLCNINSETPDHIISAIIDTITLTSELYRAILKPNRGRLLLKDMGRKFKIDFIKDIDYCCTYLELFIDSLEDKELTSLISQIVEHHPNHPRSLAIQSRILNRRGDYQTSLQILHAGLDAANQKTWNSKISDHDSHIY
jgi:tetratricopeptide (TPR) repeat protein